MRHMVLLAVLLGACSSPVAPSAPPNAEPFDPPAIYRGYWAEAEVCADTTGNFDRVRWFAVQAETTFPCQEHSSGFCSGLWRPPHDIYIAEGRVYDRGLILHEMIHDLLQTPTHDDPAWAACGLHQ